jgi:hypothetical protein
MRIFSSLLVVVVVTLSPRGRADNAPPVVVYRGPGADRCPDAEAIGARIEQIRGGKALDAPNLYQVTFARTDEGFSATIRSDRATSSVRTLEHHGGNCSALGQAVALTLVLLFDSDLESKTEVQPAPAPAPPPAAPAVVRTSPPPLPAREATSSLGAVGLAGVLRPVSPAFSADVGVGFAPLRLSAGALWAWPQTLSLGPGTVRERLLAGFARVCLPAWQRGGLRLDACSGAVAGAVTAEAVGYTRNERRTRSFVAVPFEAALSGWSSPVGWEVSLGGLFPLRRPDYTIDGVGTVYRSPPVAALLSLRVIGIVPW